jgi:antitoxin YefM
LSARPIPSMGFDWGFKLHTLIGLPIGGAMISYLSSRKGASQTAPRSNGPATAGQTAAPCLLNPTFGGLTLFWYGQYPVRVKSITYTAARENLASTINRVCEDQAPIVITKNRDQSVVMLSLAEYESLQETAFLLRSPANAKRLFAAIDALKRGKVLRKKLKMGA